MHKLIATPLLTLALALVVAPAAAQTYPARPVRILIAQAPGSATDVISRVVGNPLSQALGQPVIVEAKPGAGGALGTAEAARSAPDGYTLFMANNSTNGSNPALYPKLPYDAVNDFAPISFVASVPYVLIVEAALPAKDVQELIALAKAKPGSLNYGMTGIGNPLHLTVEMFKHAAGIELQAVPYRGDAPLNTALIAGEVHLAVVPFATAKPHVEAGRLRALAIPGAKRSPTLPQVPTIAESGLPGFESSSWQGWFVPANTPGEIVTLIQREAAKALNAPDMRERMEATANEVVASTPEAFAAVFKNDLAKFAKVVKDAKIPLQD